MLCKPNNNIGASDRRLTGPVVRRGAGGGIEPSDALKDHLEAVRKILSELEKRI